MTVPTPRDPEGDADPTVGHEIPELEYDETVPPRPEEEVADAAREEDPAGAGPDAPRADP